MYSLKLETLVTQWARFFEKKLNKEFGLITSEIDNYQLDAAPLVYCCLLHRKVEVKKWNIVLSNEFLSSKWATSDEWLKIKDILEQGKDINPYMSKSLKNWQAVDYLLYTYGIHHFHLYKNKDGGIRSELVFGVFSNDELYVLGVGNHNDLYKAESWLKILHNNWGEKNILSNVVKIINQENNFNESEFKMMANNPKLQFNMISPMQFTDDKGNVLEVKGHQHTHVIDFTLNDIKYSKIPVQAFVAYANEFDYLQLIEDHLLRKCNKKAPLILNIDLEKRKYNIKVDMGVLFSFSEEHKFIDNRLIASLYDKRKYYPYHI